MSPFAQRAAAFDQLASSPVDLLVVGGGIVGSGVARDAAMRGLRTGLVDFQDFSAGTSSRSSRLLHGGIRYLAQGRLRLVREASREKLILHRIAPHLCEPLGFLFPAYQGQGHSFWQLRMGVKIYDLLCGGANFKPSSSIPRDETLRLLPGLLSHGLQGAVRYFDALTHDARLVIDTLRSARSHGAILLNHARLHDPAREGGLWRCEIEDSIRGGSRRVRARTVVNATGPWADRLPNSTVKLRLSKGIHAVVDAATIPVPSAVVITEAERILFAIPWGSRVILGTTDTDYQGSPEDVTVDDSDVDYLLRAFGRFFPGRPITAGHLISTWAGVRPLIAQADGSPSSISRRHLIRSGQPGWWDVAGGKLTTYRMMAQEVVDCILKHLGRGGPPCQTAMEPLLRESTTGFVGGVVPSRPNRELVRHYMQNEWAMNAEDVILRRSGWHLYEPLSPVAGAEVEAWVNEFLDGQAY